MPYSDMNSEAARASRSAAMERYSKKLTRVVLNFNIESDSAVIAKLDSMPNKTDYIRGLILKDIATGQN